MTPVASADPSKLMGMLPDGFSSSNCQVKPPTAPAIEKVNCDQNSARGGPTAASFALYDNRTDMEAGLGKAADKLTNSACPGNKQSPGPWTYKEGKTGGTVQCGTTTMNSTKYAAVVWSTTSKLRNAMVIGDDLSSLYQWWQSNAG